MTTVRAKCFACGLALLGALGRAPSLHAQADLGTWVKQTTPASPGKLTMTIGTCCNGGRRFVYSIGDKQLMTVESRFDGSEAPVLVDGKPSGETMAIKRLDDHHTFAVIKMNGKPFATSKATLSADGKTLTVLNDASSAAGGQEVGKTTEVWVKK